MAIKNDKLKTFFSKSKIGDISELLPTHNGSQTVVKEASNGSQTVVKEASNGSQTVVKEASNGSQTVVKEASNGSQTVVKGASNGSQTVVKGASNNIEITSKNHVYNRYENINLFIGDQKRVLEFMCLNIDDDKTFITKHLNLSMICNEISMSIIMAKQAIYRLKKKNAIEIANRKNGRGGWCEYKINKHIALSLCKSDHIYNNNNNNITIINKEINNSEPQIKTTTTNLDIHWANIDISPLLEFGFKKTELSNLQQVENMTPEIVQESILHYAWALHNRREEIKMYSPKKDPCKGLLGVLYKGRAWIERGYKSLEEISIENELDAKREQLARLKEKNAQLLSVEFDLWYESLAPDNITEIEKTHNFEQQMPPSAFKQKGDNKFYRGVFSSYFKNNIYKKRT